MAVRYSPLRGRETYLSPVEQMNVQNQMRGQAARNQIAQHIESLRRQDAAAYSNALSNIWGAEARMSEAQAERALREKLGMAGIEERRAGRLSESEWRRQMAEQGADRFSKEFGLKERAFDQQEQLQQRGERVAFLQALIQDPTSNIKTRSWAKNQLNRIYNGENADADVPGRFDPEEADIILEVRDRANPRVTAQLEKALTDYYKAGKKDKRAVEALKQAAALFKKDAKKNGASDAIAESELQNIVYAVTGDLSEFELDWGTRDSILREELGMGPLKKPKYSRKTLIWPYDDIAKNPSKKLGRGTPRY